MGERWVYNSTSPVTSLEDHFVEFAEKNPSGFARLFARMLSGRHIDDDVFRDVGLLDADEFTVGNPVWFCDSCHTTNAFAEKRCSACGKERSGC